jgi:hypothetical protein
VIGDGIGDTVIHADKHRNVITSRCGTLKATEIVLAYSAQQRESIANICYFSGAGVTDHKVKEYGLKPHYLVLQTKELTFKIHITLNIIVVYCIYFYSMLYWI